MVPSADDKKYSSDTRLFKDAVIQDKIFKHKTNSNKFYNFESSPIIDQVEMKDICIYAPGDLNKIGKEGKTSWDSFSYAIQMGHNVWSHINAVQEANRQFDNGLTPSMLLIEDLTVLKTLTGLLEDIFSTDDRDKAMAIVNENEKFWDGIIGTRGNTGKRLHNAATEHDNIFEDDDADEEEDEAAFIERGEENLEILSKDGTL